MALFFALDGDRAAPRVRDDGRASARPCASIGAFVWSEAALVLLAAPRAGRGARAVLLAAMLVAMLQHVFDPPPDRLAIPWAYLGELAGAAVVTTTLAMIITARRLKSLPLGRSCASNRAPRGSGIHSDRRRRDSGGNADRDIHWPIQKRAG